jgi:cytochrome c-type biogenesis protein CcmE
VARKRASPARLVIALSIAAALAVFLLYTSIAGGGTPSIAPSELGDRAEQVSLAGLVVGPVTGDPHDGGMRFRLTDIGSETGVFVTVLYRGSVPDLFKTGRHVVVDGKLERGEFVAEPGSMVTKCPSKYSDKPLPDQL